MAEIIELTKENFNQEVLQSDLPILVDFWAPWCQPCLMMIPILEQIAEELDGKLRIGKLNTETIENQKLAIQYQIRSIPNMKLFKNGKVINEFIGLRPKESLKEELSGEINFG